MPVIVADTDLYLPKTIMEILTKTVSDSSLDKLLSVRNENKNFDFRPNNTQSQGNKCAY